MTQTPPSKLRSRAWFDNPANVDMTSLYLERYLNFGLSLEELRSGKPIIGIAQTGSDLSPCNRHHLVLAERIREGTQIEHLGAWLRAVVRNRGMHQWRQAPTVPLDELGEPAGAQSAASVAEDREDCRAALEREYPEARIFEIARFFYRHIK